MTKEQETIWENTSPMLCTGTSVTQKLSHLMRKCKNFNNKKLSKTESENML